MAVRAGWRLGRRRPGRTRLPDGPGLNPWRQWSFLQRPRPEHLWLRRHYGAAVTIYTAEFRLVLFLTSEGAREVLSADPEGYGPAFQQSLTNLTGEGALWVLQGARHRRERQLLAPAFHGQRIRDYGRAIQEHARRHSDEWQRGLELRIYDAMIAMARDTILRIVFSIEHGALLDEGRRLMTTVLRATRPSIAYVPMFQAPWFPPWRRYHHATRAFGAFTERRMAARRASGEDRPDVMGLMLAARYEDDEPIPDPEILAELGTLAFTGHVTTATALSWAIYELWRHPAVLARLREELDALGPDPEPELIATQPYLGAVCDETLRLHTMLPEVGRIVLTPRVLGGYTIPAGTAVGVGIGAIHQDPAIYPQPDRFRPERFLERSFSQYEFLPYGGGHRRCPGAALSDYETRITLAAIVSRWELESAGEDQEVRQSVITGPKHGVRMRVIGRRRPA